MAASVRDVAREAGVSLGTVSNVLNNPQNVAPENVAKVQAAIKKLSFVRNDAARQLRAGRSRGIGVIVQDIRNPFYAELTRGAEDEAVDFDLGILIADSADDAERQRFILGLFEEQRVLGILATLITDNLEILQGIKRRGTPVVIVDRKSPDATISSVSVDDVAGGNMAVEHLLGSGRSRIAFAGGPLSELEMSERLDGARGAVANHPGAQLEVFETVEQTVLEGRRIGGEVIARSPGDRPDAIFAANDLLALGIMQAVVLSKEISIPRDLALIGYDDISFAQTAIVPLSSVRQPSSEIGAHAVKLLVEESQSESAIQPQQFVFHPTLVVRESTSG